MIHEILYRFWKDDHGKKFECSVVPRHGGDPVTISKTVHVGRKYFFFINSKPVTIICNCNSDFFRNL